MFWRGGKSRAGKLVVAVAAVSILAIMLAPSGLVFAGSGVVMGQVFMPDGMTPFTNGGTVEAANAKPNGEHTGTAGWGNLGSDGRFRIEGLADGLYMLALNIDHGDTMLPPEHIFFEITGGSTVTLNPKFSLVSKTLAGRVVRENGEPVVGANIHADQDGKRHVMDKTNSAGEYTLRLSRGSWNVNPWNEDADWIYNRPQTVVSFGDNDAPETRSLDFQVVTARSRVTGKIVLPDGSFPPPNAVHVHLDSQDGMGQGDSVRDLGLFNIRLPAGVYKFNTWIPDLPYAGPSGWTVEVKDNAVTDLGTIVLKLKEYHIKGRITDLSGNGIAGVKVNGWKHNSDGEGSAATTDANGYYDMPVMEGRYGIGLMNEPPVPGQDRPTYVYIGPPIDVGVGPDTPDKTVSGVDLRVVLADSTIAGTVRYKGQVLASANGWVNIRPADSYNGGLGGGLNNGSFAIKAPAGSYRLDVGFRDGEYSLAKEVQVTVASGQTATVDIDLEANTSVIRGWLRTPDGKIVTGIHADICVNDQTPRGRHFHGESSKDGSYKVRVGTGSWQVNAHFRDAPYIVLPPPPGTKIVVGENHTVEYDILLYPADSVISGTVRKPDGMAVSRAWVHADNHFEGNEAAKGGLFERGFGTGGEVQPNGTFTLYVPAGTYMVGAGVPPGVEGVMNPPTQKVTVAPGKPARIDLIFRKSDAVISGAILLGGRKVQGHISAWSEKGGFSDAHSDNGNFILNVSSGDTWYINAVLEGRSISDEQGEIYYESGDVAVTVNQSRIPLNLVLTRSPFRLPPPVTATFDASQEKVIHLPDGGRITVPAGALAASGTVQVVVIPKAAMARQSRAKPVGIGYDLGAFDSNNKKISSRFNSPVTIVIPYNQDMLAEAGVTEDDLFGAYWDETSNTWKEMSGVSIDRQAQSITITTDHFTQFAATTAKAGTAKPSVTYAWKTVSAKGASGGSYATNNVAGASATVRFTGSSATLYTVKGPDQGVAVIYVDGKLARRVDNYAAKSALRAAVPIAGLRNTAHSVVIRVDGAKNRASKGTFVSVDALVAGKAVTQNTDSSVRYAWKSQTIRAAGSGALTLSDLAGTSFAVKFKGSTFTWYTATGPTMGVAKIFIDGKLRATVDNYAGKAAYRVARSVAKLSISVHTASVVVTGAKRKSSKGSYVVVDYVGVK